MIPPQELRNKSFTRSAKGYDIAEVDEYLDFVIEKYSEIFAQCDKYDKKLRIVSSRISDIQREEETIHRLIIQTQKNCDRLVSEAEVEARDKILSAQKIAENILFDAKDKAQSILSSVEQKSDMQIESAQQKSDALLLSARTRCTKLLSDFKKEIAVQRENVFSIKDIAEEFNAKLLSMYKNHLNLLSENTYTPNIDLDKFTESRLFDSIMQEIKNDAAEIARKTAGDEYDFEKDLAALKEYKLSIHDLQTEIDDVKTAGNTYSAAEDNTDDIDETEDEDDVKVYGKYEEHRDDDADEDIKVFSKSGASPANPTQNSYNSSDDNAGGYSEKPRATYDSDDYEYENSGVNAGYDDEDDGEEDSQYMDEDDDDDDTYNYADENGDSDDESEYIDEDSKRASKGFFGLFKKKKKKEPSKRYISDSDDDYDDDDDDDNYDDNMDIFDDQQDR